MQHLLLEPPKHALNGLRAAVVRGSGPIHAAQLLQKALALKLLVTTLVVANNLVRLMLAHLNGHPVRHVLRLVVLIVGYAKT